MSLFPWHKKRSPHNSPTANGLASQSKASQHLQFSTKSQSQSHLQSPQQTQQSQPLYPWSAHVPPSGQWPSPFPRSSHALSTAATAAGELFLFGGSTHDSICDDLHMISTRDFSTTLLNTSGDIPSPRYGHHAVLAGTTLLIWGGTTELSNQKTQSQSDDDSFYLLDLVSLEWTRIVVDGPGPGRRYYHTMTLVGSKLFVFGGRTDKRRLNDIWAFDLNSLKSNPFWESYEPAPGNKKPLPRAGHVSATTGDRIIIFGGRGDPHDFNDTWSFDISTRKWTELQCSGSTPSPRTEHAAVLVDGVMYVFGGRSIDEAKLGDLTALDLSTQRWIAFQDVDPSPCGRWGHAMASDGRRVFVLGGLLSPGAEGDETKLIHVLDTKHLDYPEPDSDAVNPSEKTTQLVRKSSPSPLTRRQPHQPSSSSSDAHAVHGASPFQKATPEELDHPTFQRITREQYLSPNSLPSRPTGASGRPRRVPEEIARLEDGRLTELERQLSETLVAKTERDRRIAQLTDELTLKTALLEQAEANAAKVEKHAGLELRELQAKLDESLLSRDHALEKAEANAAEEKRRAGLGLHELQAKLDKSLLSRDQAEANAAEAKKLAVLVQRGLQARLDGLLLSRDQALEQAQSALQKATFRAAEANANGGSQPPCEHETELAEVHAKLEAKESELAAVSSRLTDAEDGWAKSKAEADALRAQTAAGLVNTDVDQVMHRLMERMRTMEAEMGQMASRQWNEKSIESMECRNEG